MDTMQIAWHKHGVLVLRVLNLAPGYVKGVGDAIECGALAKELEDARPSTSTRIGKSQ